MLPTFTGEIHDGKLCISDFERGEKFLEGKHLAITILEVSDDNKLSGGNLVAGVFKKGNLVTSKGETSLKSYNGKSVFVTIRNELLAPISLSAFDRKFQLGGRPNDMDT